MTAQAVSTGGTGKTLYGGGTAGLHTLFSQGPFTLVGQCIIGSGLGNDVEALTYLVTTEPHGADGMAVSEEDQSQPDDSSPSTAEWFNSASEGNPLQVVEAAPNFGSSETSVVTGSTDAAWIGGENGDGAGWSAVSSDLKTQIDGTSANGANVGGPPSTDCVFEGTITHN